MLARLPVYSMVCSVDHMRVRMTDGPLTQVRLRAWNRMCECMPHEMWMHIPVLRRRRLHAGVHCEPWNGIRLLWNPTLSLIAVFDMELLYHCFASSIDVA